MSTKRDKAVRYLTWYLKLLFEMAGICWDESNDADVECIVDFIIDAAAEAAERNDLYLETYKRCNECLECLECHHFGNGCDGDIAPCEAFEYHR